MLAKPTIAPVAHRLELISNYWEDHWEEAGIDPDSIALVTDSEGLAPIRELVGPEVADVTGAFVCFGNFGYRFVYVTSSPTPDSPDALYSRVENPNG